MENNNGLEQEPARQASMIVPEQPSGMPPIEVKTSKKTAFVVAGAVVLVVVGWFSYNAYASPGKVWQKFSAKDFTPSSAVQANFDVSYTDHGKLTPEQEKSNPFAKFFSQLKLTLNGSEYVDERNMNSLQISADVNYNLASGDTSFGSRMQFIFKDQSIFMNLGNSPFLAGIFANLSPGERIEWIKIDTKELQEAMQTGSSTPPAMADYSKRIEEYKLIMKKYSGKLVTMKKFMGKEDVKGVSTFHFSNELNKPELKALLNEVIDAAIKNAVAQNQTSADEAVKAKEGIKNVLAGVIDRTEVKTFETWVGSSDFLLHRYKFIATAPSIVSLAGLASDMSGSGKSLSSANPQQQVLDLFAEVSYDAELSMDETLSDYGKIQEIKTPENVFDLGKKLIDAQKMQKSTTNQPILESKTR